MNERMKCVKFSDKIMSAARAAEFIKPGMTLGMSGFTPSGYAKAVPLALAQRAENGEKLDLTIMTGASVGDEVDGALTRAGAISRRMPYQTHRDMRGGINAGEIDFFDVHLSQVPVWVKNGFMGKVDFAIVELSSITADGKLIPSASIGAANTFMDRAEKIILEVNAWQPESLRGVHDVYSVAPVPDSQPIPIVKPRDRIGADGYKCDPDKIVAIVLTDMPDGGRNIQDPDLVSQQMANHIVEILKNESADGRLPLPLPPLQSGVGGVANAVLEGLAKSDFENLTIYSEVLQDAVFTLIDSGKVVFASGTSLTISPAYTERFRANFDKYRDKIILRPMEISNHPEVIRRLGIIAMNTVIEADIYGNTNSSHIGGSRLMNGIGGSGDFAQNAGLSIFITPSVAKGGELSCIVPFVAHVDHTEHDIHFLVTEQGYADVRGLSPKERALRIIENCAHPKFRDGLLDYFHRAQEAGKHKHTPHLLHEVFGV